MRVATKKQPGTDCKANIIGFSKLFRELKKVLKYLLQDWALYIYSPNFYFSLLSLWKEDIFRTEKNLEVIFFSVLISQITKLNSVRLRVLLKLTQSQKSNFQFSQIFFLKRLPSTVMLLGAGPEEVLRERRVLICILRDPWTLCFWFCVHFSYFILFFLFQE